VTDIESSPFEGGDELIRSGRDDAGQRAAAEQEQSYLKLLLALKAQPEAERHAGLVASIARWVSSEKVLRAISIVPAWFDDWQVREALFGNSATDEGVRGRISICLAVFELVRELDRADLSNEDRDEIKDEVREQIAILEDHDKELVKARLKNRAGKRKEVDELAPGPVAVGPESFSAPVPETEVPGASAVGAGLDPMLQALMEELGTASPAPAGGAREETPFSGESADSVPSEVDPTLRAMMENFLAPETAADESGLPRPATPALFGLDSEEVTGVLETSPGEDSRPPETVKPPAPVVAASHPPLATAPPPPVEEPRPFAVPAGARVILSSEERAELASLPAEQKASLGGVTNRIEQLAVLITEKESRIIEAVLDNPNLPESLVTANIPAFGARQIELLLKRKRWSNRGPIRTAILFNPNTHPNDAISIVENVSDPRALLEVMRSPRILSPQVKQRAKDKIVQRYWAMTVEERVALIRSTGGSIFRDLWEQIFRDETALAELVRDRALEEPVVIQMAHSAMTPRSILNSISLNSAWTSNYTILLELVKNPKTPREATARLIPRLRPADKKALRLDPSIPPALRAKLG